jgi:hypothetical protein
MFASRSPLNLDAEVHSHFSEIISLDTQAPGLPMLFPEALLFLEGCRRCMTLLTGGFR